MPALQKEHTPQVRASHGIPTRSPVLKRVAFLPHAATRPTISWPGTRGSLGFGNSPSMTCRSVLQTAHALTRTRTSPSAGSGSCTSVSFSAAFVWNSTIARISKHYDANSGGTSKGVLLDSEVAGREYAGG